MAVILRWHAVRSGAQQDEPTAQRGCGGCALHNDDTTKGKTMFAVLTDTSLEEVRDVAASINADPLEILCAIEGWGGLYLAHDAERVEGGE
jgi:hypothetical protein